MKIKFKELIIGEYVILRKITQEDAQEIYDWRRGSSGKHMRSPEGYSLEMQKTWIRNRSSDEINYMIMDKISRMKLGTIGIYDVNESDLVTNVGRFLLCEKLLGKSSPYGLESLLLTYNFVFNSMNFRKITGDILASNIAMVKLQKFLGMKEEGYLEKHVSINGELHDLHIVSIFKEQFNREYKIKLIFFLKSFK